MSKKSKEQVVESNEIETQTETKAKKPGFIRTFGKIFQEFGVQGKEIVQAKMLEIFPEKSETILKWTEWYKAYYNMGKIHGYNPTADQKIHWRKVSE